MEQLPLVRLRKQLLLRQADAGPRGKRLYDLPELRLVRRAEIDRNAEAVNQGKLLLHRIVGVKLVVPLLFVAEFFPDQVPSVGGGVDQHVVRLLLQSALDDRLQILVFRLKILKAQIVHVNDEPVIAVLDLRDHVVQIPELVAVYLNDTQAPVVVFVGDGLDAGGFSRSRVPVQQTVVRLSSRHEGLRIFHQLLFRRLIAHQVGKLHMGDVQDRLDLHCFVPVRVSLMPDAEGLVQPEFSHAVLPVKLSQPLLHLLRRRRFGKPHRERADPVPDAGIVDPAFLLVSLVGKHLRKFRNAERAGRLRIIEGEQLPENGDVMKHRLVDGPFHRPADLAGAAVAVFMADQEIAQITVPDIPVKPVASRQLQKAAHAGIQLFSRLFPLFRIMAGDPRHFGKQLSFLSKIPVYDQFLHSHPSHPFRGFNNSPAPACFWLRPAGRAGRSSPRCPPGSRQNR